MYYVRVYGECYKHAKGAVVVNKGTVNEMILVPIEQDDTYRCVMGARADFEERGWDTSSLTSVQMDRIFDKIGEYLVGYGGYWESIDAWAKFENLPRRADFDEE